MTLSSWGRWYQWCMSAFCQVSGNVQISTISKFVCLFIRVMWCHPHPGLSPSHYHYLLTPQCHHHLCHHQSLLLFFILDLKHTSSWNLFHHGLHHRYSLDWSHGLPAGPFFLLLIGSLSVFSSRLSAVDWAYIRRLLSALYTFSFYSFIHFIHSSMESCILPSGDVARPADPQPLYQMRPSHPGARIETSMSSLHLLGCLARMLLSPTISIITVS